MSDVTKLLATNDTFAEVADLLFGGGGDELITKISPTQSDLATHERKKRAAVAGLSAVGATAGAAGLGIAGRQMYRGFRAAPKAMKFGQKVAHAAREDKVATGLIPLEVAGLGGEIASTKILHGDTKKKSFGKRDVGDMLSQASSNPKHKLTRAMLNPRTRSKAMETTRKVGGKLRLLPTGATGHADVDKALRLNKAKLKASYDQAKREGRVDPNGINEQARRRMSKRDEVTWEGEFAKVDNEKQQVFGWASVIEVNGEPVIDLQGDRISAEEMEKAGYSYVMKSRKGGDMHLRDMGEPIQKSEMIESFIVTDEKREAMGLPSSVPTGWWVGFQVQDPGLWHDIKEGRRTGFSIHGHGRRTPAGV